MKLARLEHWKCDEPMYWRSGGGYTYVWVPDEMTAEELDSLCEQAQKAYLDAEHEFKNAAPVGAPGYGADIPSNAPDTMTVGDLRRSHEAKVVAHKAYQALVEKSRKPFAWHLHNVSGGTIIQFWQEEPDMSVKVDWGHNHGVTIEHSPTVMGDYPFPEDDDE